jgi:hypothetical protein
MATINPTTELDFDQIKADIIAYIKADTTFTDYNFEGSALNSIIDILAYNTHTNAYYANMLHAEGFLDTAQKRSSVVSKAKELGYIPRSVAGSVAYIDVSVLGITDPTIYINRGTLLTSTNDVGTHSFVVVEDHSSTTVGDTKQFSNIKLVEGVLTTNYFKVDTISNIRSIFTIPNQNIDITTLKVYVRDSISSTTSVEYTRTISVHELTPTSKTFFIQESYDGNYQIYFGQNIVGLQPVNGNIIDISYIVSSNKSASNGCKNFYFNDNIGTSISTVTTQVSFGGGEKESITSIKDNAVKSYSAKHRSVTASDYEITLKENFNFIKSVSVWGGEDAVPPVYGKVFLSIQPVSGYTISDTVKNDVILPALKKTSLLTVTPAFVDPTYTILNFATKIKFNQNKTTLSKYAIESAIKGIVIDYVDSISTFNTDYLHSVLVKSIGDIDAGISSVDVSKTVGFKLSPLIGVESRHIKNINNSIVAGSILSSKFNVYIDSAVVAVQIKPIESSVVVMIDSSGVSQVVYRLGLYNSDSVMMKDIGSVNLTTGTFDFAFGLYSYITSNRFISISCEVVESDITVARNQILILETDLEDAAIGVFSNNTVDIEVYGK